MQLKIIFSSSELGISRKYYVVIVMDKTYEQVKYLQSVKVLAVYSLVYLCNYVLSLAY